MITLFVLLAQTYAPLIRVAASYYCARAICHHTPPRHDCHEIAIDDPPPAACPDRLPPPPRLSP